MFLSLLATFILAIITFHINHQIKKINDIRIVINTLFELYGTPESFTINDVKEINLILSNEILTIEKMHDSNSYISKQIVKLRKLRLIYFDYINDKSIDIVERLKKINHKRLNKSFILITYLNITP